MLRAAHDCHKHRQDKQLLVILGLFLLGMKKIPEKTLSAMEHLPVGHHLAHFNIPMHLRARQLLSCVRHLEVIYGRALLCGSTMLPLLHPCHIVSFILLCSVTATTRCYSVKLQLQLMFQQAFPSLCIHETTNEAFCL